MNKGKHIVYENSWDGLGEKAGGRNPRWGAVRLKKGSTRSRKQRGKRTTLASLRATEKN